MKLDSTLGDITFNMRSLDKLHLIGILAIIISEPHSTLKATKQLNCEILTT